MEWLYKLNDWISEDLSCAIITITESYGSSPRKEGSKMVINEKGDLAGSIGGGALEFDCISLAKKAIKQNKPILKEYLLNGEEWISNSNSDNKPKKMICGGKIKVFIEPINISNKKEIVIFGAGHIAEKLSKLCDIVKIPYKVFDDREDFLTQNRFKNAKELILGKYNELDKFINLNNNSFCVIMTYGHKYDSICLEKLVKIKEIPYIGMIGSKNKVRTALQDLRKKGLYPDERIYSPIGLYLGSNLPEEIALSIISEIALIMRNGKLKHRRLEAPNI